MIRTAQYGFAILFVVHQQNERKRRVQLMGQIPGWSDEDADRWCEGHYRPSVKASVRQRTNIQIKKCAPLNGLGCILMEAWMTQSANPSPTVAIPRWSTERHNYDITAESETKSRAR